MPALLRTLVCDAAKIKKKVLLRTGCLVLSVANLLPNLIWCPVRSEAEQGRSAFGLSGSSALLVFKRRDHNLCLHQEEWLSNSISSGNAGCALHTPCRSSRVPERWRNLRGQAAAQASAGFCVLLWASEEDLGWEEHCEAAPQVWGHGRVSLHRIFPFAGSEGPKPLSTAWEGGV